MCVQKRRLDKSDDVITAESRHRSATRAYSTRHWVMMATLRLLGMPLSMVSDWGVSRRIVTECVSAHVLSFLGRQVNA